MTIILVAATVFLVNKVSSNGCGLIFPQKMVRENIVVYTMAVFIQSVKYSCHSSHEH